MQDAGAAVNRPRRGFHLIWSGGGEHVARARGVQHPQADEAAVEWLVAGATARHEANLAALWATGAENDPVGGIDLHHVGMRRAETGQTLRHQVLDAIDELLDSRYSWSGHVANSFQYQASAWAGSATATPGTSAVRWCPTYSYRKAPARPPTTGPTR